ncbi:MAG: hypothetical protein ACYC6N_05420 [Pirellulaceae bacterium]
MNARFRRTGFGRGGTMIWVCFAVTLFSRYVAGDDHQALSKELEAARKRATAQSHLLQYRFLKGERICWTVKHLSTTEATIQGKTETTKSRSISTKVWEVQDVDAEGNATLVHSVSEIDMWQQIADRPEVRYNSRTDATPPPEYLHVAKTVGTPLATVRISPAGKMLERNAAPPQVNLGLGEFAVPLPAEPVQIGQQWRTTSEILVRRQDGTKKRIKTRMVYTLKSVKTGVATIVVKTEVVTPVNDPRIQSQLVQQITDGEIRLDVDAGRILGREIDWDETVVGFSGHDSLMKYLARYTEEMQPAAETAQQAGAAQR